MGALFNYGSIFGLYILGAVVWSLAVIWILFDAEHHYNAGCLWVLFTLIAPLIAVPVYLMMRLGAVRSAGDEQLAELRREERIAGSSPVARFRKSADGAIQRIPGAWERETSSAVEGFKPFNPHSAVWERAQEAAGKRQAGMARQSSGRGIADEPPF